MVAAFIAAVAIAAILFVSEYAWKRFKLREELARKFVHITAGSFIAFLPFWVEYDWIKILAVGFVIVNSINHFTNTFHAIQSVKRKSIGDILFGVGVFAVAWFEPPAWLFAASVLQVSLADGLAALAGVEYGLKRNKYYLFGQPKSVIGSAVFLVASVLILSVTFITADYFASPLNMWPVAAMLPLMLVCVENLAVYGTDNLFLPLATLGVLSLL